jgi:hypothetical protein
MAVYQECKNTKASQKNTGAKEQCLEGLFIKPALAIPGFAFDNAEDAKTKSVWDAAVAAKQIFPLYEAEELASANTEDTFFEGRSRQYRTASGKKVSSFSTFLGLCSHSALKSFHGKEMQLFEFTEDGAIKGVITDQGKIKGQDVVLNIGKRLDATADRPPSTLVTINYKSADQFEDDGAILRPDAWGYVDLYGVFDVNLIQVSASATQIKFTANDGCAGGGDSLAAFVAANFKVRDLAGAVVTTTFVEADQNDVYTIIGTGFANGFTVELDGVVSMAGMAYESPEKLIVAIV